LCPEWVDQNERKHVDRDPDVGYYGTLLNLTERT
jgi:hypothetical protein